jgi:hypothetical protein
MSYAGVREEIGSSGRPFVLSKANRNYRQLYTKATNKTGTAIRGMYWKQSFTSTGEGEVIRAIGAANGTLSATAGTINAIHATGRVESGKTVSGAVNAIRATLEIAGTTPTPGGTLSALNLDVNASATTTWGTEDAYVKVTDSGSTALTSLFNFTAASASNDPTVLVSSHADHASTHLIKCRVAGADMWLLATNAH